jgi:tetratricopeptide (TPR) repeat protein
MDGRMLRAAFARGLAVLLALLLALPAAAIPLPQQGSSSGQPVASDLRRAREAFDSGRRAEASGDWAVAFEYYSEAANRHPSHSEYLSQRERARFRLVESRVARAEQAAAAGRFEQAVLELRAALALDPGYSVAQQRLRQFESRLAQGVRVLPALVAEDVTLRPDAGVRDFDFRGNTRGAYEEVARAFGISVDFDSELRVAPVRLRLENADFATVMNVLGQITGTFWRATDRRSMFVVSNTAAKRREYAPSVVRTVLLGESATPEDMTEILRAIRELTGIQRTQLDTRTHTLTLRDEPEKVNLAVELIRELERPRGETMLEIRILEVDRGDALRLGILPPSSARIFTISPQDLDTLQDPQSSPQELAEVLQRIFGTATTGFGLGGLIPPLVAFGGGRTVFLATLPGASAEFAQSYSALRRARRMLLRSLDGESATFFIGERFPINLAVLSTGFAQGAFPGSVPNIPQLNEFSVGDSPAALIAFDFNADGVVDLAAANSSDDTVSILLGNGNGTFAASTAFAAGDGPSGLAAGDFDADGFLDLAVVNQNDNTVSILLGNGDGTFNAPTSFATGASPRAIVAANLNTGTALDLIVANHGDNNISVLLGNGDGTFGTPANFPTGLGPIALAVADLDNDTFLDVVVANQTSDSVSVLLGNGTGSLGTTTDFPTGAGPRAVITGDFDGQNGPDVATANETANSVSILLNNGSGSFGSSTDFGVGNAPSSLITADLDGLGNLDLAVANRDDDTVSVLLGSGDGTFAVRVDFQAGDAPVAIVSSNLNSDGRMDLVTANQDADSVTIILNSTVVGDLSAFQPQPYPAFQYEDLGLKVEATPRLHAENEVTLQLRMEIRSRSGEALNGIPVITNRTLEQTVRLREDETTLIAGILQDEERRGIDGWPGIGRAPGIGRGTSLRDNEDRQTELIVLITPRRIRLAPRAGRSLYAGRDPVGTSPGAPPPPPSVPPQPGVQPQPQPQPQPLPPPPPPQPQPEPRPEPPQPEPPPEPPVN